MKAALWERIKTADFLTDNEKRKMVGLKTYGTAGDYIWKAMGLTPLTEEGIADMLAPVDETIPADDADNPDNKPKPADDEDTEDDEDTTE